MSAYGEAALDRECAQMAATDAGRNDRLNRAAFCIGQLVGAGAIDRRLAESRLFAAAEASGYVPKDGAIQARATIKSGLDCGEREPREVVDAGDRAKRPSPARAPKPRQDNDDVGKVLWLWPQRRPIIEGSPPWRYLREARGYHGPIPPTLGFLPARDAHPPALIAAFGICSEPEPGELAIADADVKAVQIIRLRPDGSSKADEPPPNKIVVGKGAMGTPIVLAPPNELLGLAIAEGIEDAMSIHGATGLGAWASGGATRMPALTGAVPGWMDCVTVLAHRDPAGVRGAEGLAAELRKRCIHVEVAFLKAGERDT